MRLVNVYRCELLMVVLLGIGVPERAISQSASTAAPALAVSHQPARPGPGDAVLITITAGEPLESVSGQAFGQPLALFQGESAATWHALVGIDLATAPQKHAVTIEARTVSRRTVRTVYSLIVVPKAFGVRRLKVPEKFVTPPASALERIARDQKRLAAVYAASSASRLWGGPFERPTDGAPVSPFGVRSDYNGKRGTPHRGTDFAGATGAPVRAPGAGRVVLAEDLYYSGTTVIIDHGLGLFSVLAHLSRIDVREGDSVVRGARVGAVGATGRVTGPHLHWSVRIGPASVDPLSLIAVTETR
jgi:murein DD-endopeptidase MepM/ murein hydrolase activator NlpD